MLLSASFVLFGLVGAAVSYVALRTQPESVQLAALVGTAGLFAVAVFEDMIREAHATAEDTRVSTVALLLGFAAFVLVSASTG